MTLAAIPRGILYPTVDYSVAFVGATLDAATEKCAHIGRLYIDGRPAGTKTLSTGTIQYRTASVTFANAGTTVDIGIQGVAAGAGPIAQPDGTFTVKTTLTGGGAGITGNAWNTATMNSGTVSLSHGDLIAVVWDMTARAGADTVTVQASSPGGQPGALTVTGGNGFPITNAFFSSAWQTTVVSGAGSYPNVVIVFDDGTLGWIDFSLPLSVVATAETFADATNPDERGMIFQVPWDCKIDALWVGGGHTDANSDFTLKVYSDPLGTPTLVASVAVLAEQLTVNATNKLIMELLASEVALTRNTDYAVTILATGSSNARLIGSTLGNTAHRATIPGGTTLKKVTRNNSTGAFTAESPAVTMYAIGVRISQLHDTDQGGGPVGHQST